MNEKRILTAKVKSRGPEAARIHVTVPRSWHLGGLAGTLLVDARHADHVAGLIDNAEELLDACRCLVAWIADLADSG